MNFTKNEKALSRREFLVRAEMGVAGAYLALAGMSDAAAVPPNAPNIIFIMADDLRYDAIGCLGNPPWLKTPNLDRLVNEGMLFRNAFCTTSLSGPSRASFLTGEYAHKTGIVNNFTEFSEKNTTFPSRLQKGGYDTAFIGKWHMDQQNEPQPGFNKWVSFPGQGEYTNPVLNVDGEEFKHSGYLSDILNGYASNFILKQAGEKNPFCLYLCHKAVHDMLIPEPSHAKLYEKETYPLPPNAHYDLKGKPNCVRERSEIAADLSFPPDPEKWQEETRQYYRCLACIDEGVGMFLKTLEEIKKQDDTIIILTSDNGYFLGEHGLRGKRFAYEASIRIPFVAYYPKMIKPGSVCDEMILNIDVTPTMLELADRRFPKGIQGKSFKPLLEGKDKKWREDFLYHYHLDVDISKMTPQEKDDFYKKWKDLGVDPQTLLVPENLAVRSKEWKYITYPGINETDELYNLVKDPYEMENLISDPAYAYIVAEMKDRLEKLVKDTD